MKYAIIIYLIWNVIAFILMGIDKYKAKHKKWRISEASLLIVSFIMGGLGSFIGSHFFRHKTQKSKFKLLLPFSILCNWLIIYFIIVHISKI